LNKGSRAELGITTAELMGLNVVESKVDKLVKEIQQLSDEDRRELFDRVSIN
jgi:isopropylmalate/homocitrate/citramalate synthase